MGLIANLRKRWTEPIEFIGRSSKYSLANPSQEFIQLVAASQTSDASVAVSPEVALKTMGLYAAITTIVEPLSHMPIPVMEVDGRNRTRLRSHPVWRILNQVFNDEQHSMEGREMLLGHYILRGNAYGQILRDRSGRAAQVWPLHPDRMKIERRSEKLVYIYMDANGDEWTLQKENVLHLRNVLDSEGVSGVGFIRRAANAIGLTIATERYASKLYANGARPSGVLKHPGKLKDAAYERLKKEFADKYQGIENLGKVAILEEGMDWQKMGFTAEESQLIESRKFQIEDIARGLRVPGHKVGLLDKATFSNIEHQNLEFVVFTLMGHARRFELTCERDLLTEKERESVELRYNFNSLLRGDIKTRSEAYAIGRMWGWMSADDVRELEDLDPLPENQGQIYLLPQNYIDARKIDEVTPSSKPLAPAEQSTPRSRSENDLFRPAYRQAFMVTLVDACNRIVRKEAKAAENALKSASLKGSPEQFRAKIAAFYDEFEAEVLSNIDTLAVSFGYMVAENDVRRQEEIREKAKNVAKNALLDGENALVLHDFSSPEVAYLAISRTIATWRSDRAKEIANAVIDDLDSYAKEALRICA
ncbi:MAG: phage portal protein [Candidatus Melainabacteria bacterium]|nr:phage portal protein [Candidatus Melainabacteria bacterium]